MGRPRTYEKPKQDEDTAKLVSKVDIEFVNQMIGKSEEMGDFKISKSTLANMQLDDSEKDNYRDRIFAILSYWGDGTLNTSTKGYIGSVSINIFKEFELGCRI